jgi:hypothetical protein
LLSGNFDFDLFGFDLVALGRMYLEHAAAVWLKITGDAPGLDESGSAGAEVSEQTAEFGVISEP